MTQFSIFELTQQHTNNWEADISNANFSPLLMSCQLGMDEFTIFFLMTNDMMSLLEISRCSCVYFVANVGNFFGRSWGICAM